MGGPGPDRAGPRAAVVGDGLRGRVRCRRVGAADAVHPVDADHPDRAGRNPATARSLARARARGRLGPGRLGRAVGDMGGLGGRGARRRRQAGDVRRDPDRAACGDRRSALTARRRSRCGWRHRGDRCLHPGEDADRRAVDLPGRQAQRAGRIPQRHRAAVLHRLLAADRHRRHARARACAARGLSGPCRADAGARLSDPVTRCPDRAGLRCGRGAGSGSRSGPPPVACAPQRRSARVLLAHGC